MTVIAVANQKGGCGKTTTAINLAACLGQKGQHVLLIDMDPQGHASLGLGMRCEDIPGLYEVFAGEATLDEVVLPEVVPGVDVVPATISLAAAEHLLEDSAQRERQLSRHLDPLRHRYHYMVIDCPPALGFLSVNALRAADQVLIPIEMSLFALDGIDRLCETVALLREKYQVDLPIRVVPTLVDNRTRLTRQFLRQIWERFADEVSPVMVHYTVRLKEAVVAGKPIISFDPSSPAATQYMRLADEVIDGLGERRRAVDAPGDPPPVSRPAGVFIDASFRPEAPAGTGPAGEDRRQRVILRLPGFAGQHVQVAGDFNDWIPDRGVETRVHDGMLEKILIVAPGLYQYRLVVDGKWIDDPVNPARIPNHVGGHNSLLRVHARREPATA
jgi:chromosome partitioning protein